MSKIAIALAAAGLVASTVAASAYDGRYGGSSIDKRQAFQAQRIEQGRRSGELTRGEYAKLKFEQSRIAAMERRAKADGHLSHSERARIRAAQNAASRHIAHETHDSQRRGYRRWW